MFRKNKRGKHNDEEHEFVVILIKDRSVKNMMGTSNDLYFYRNKEARIRFNYPLGDATYVGFSSINELEEYGRVLIFINGELCYETKREDAIENKSNLNLLEIKLKDTDSVPEVWYRGERVDELPNGLVDVYMHWHTCEADKPTKLMAILEYVEGTDIDAKRIEVYIDEEGERGSFNLLKDEIDD